MTDFNLSPDTSGTVTVTDGSVSLSPTPAGGGTVVVDAPAPVDPVVVAPPIPRLEAIARAERLAAEAKTAEDRFLDAKLRSDMLDEQRAQVEIELARLSAEKERATEDISAKIREIDALSAIEEIPFEEYDWIIADLLAELHELQQAE